MGAVEKSVIALVEPIAEKCGVFVVDVEYKKQQNGMNLTVYIDKKGGVTLDDCERVHTAIDEPLDELDPTNGESYILNVSSPGLDRNLNSDRALEYAIQMNVDVGLYAPIENRKQFSDVMLVGFDKEHITIKEGECEYTLLRKQISKITKHINF